MSRRGQPSSRPGSHRGRRGRGLRVIAGSAGGLRLVAPAGTRTRPTADRVKEALFAALTHDRLVDATVLDLYAGSGAFAIESLSRGAGRAVLVDRDPEALDAIARNLTSTRFADRARVHRGAVVPFLGGLPALEAPFALVFIDAPYDTPDEEVGVVLERLCDRDWLDENATVVIERPVGSVPPMPEGLEVVWERSYGDTLVLIATARF